MTANNFTLACAGQREPIAGDVFSLVNACEKLGLVRTRCRQGRCGACQVKFVSGEYSEWAPMLALTEKERGHNAILPCVLVPLSDIEVEAWYP
ncbi:2Fe-2S iron-sulfur cluster binding domain-containing protein [Pseudomonas sp. 18.1.10]|uniref:2Fe-2S iron-sulfur cluster binding domain-containing protein n=1 Tax=Pseudomonas sp. 18.1.10 TaxID=2969302 RepID=UPI00214FB9D7|nr:2Fe-2S iron-sulfur cluster binding domain-containing protein [Pseudomonas sp. 18.1.10]MCR4540882.1 2Fe-2S iron-sulfur cluster binding domain-containing protein [Pseudomonas sp. 18.1.10]